MNNNLKNVSNILEKVIPEAVKYYELTGNPLGITGEIGEFLAAKELNLKLMEARKED